MDSQTKKMIGLFLGEVYEIKALLKGEPVEKSRLYALKNGFESVINDMIDENWWVSSDDEHKVAKILQPYFEDDSKLAKLKGFYDIEAELEDVGITRLKALAIMKYFYAKRSFITVLDKMDTEYSPVECRKFNLSEYDY
jgi:hypothetical protein